MSAQDQLEIINSHGDVRFHDLNTGRGITNIGRHPDNDIVIESDAVAPFHAILDHQNRPFRLISLSADKIVKVSGQVLQPNVPRELRNWDTIELDGTSIILMEGGAATGQQAPSIIPAPLPTSAPIIPTPAASVMPPGVPPSSAEPAIPDLDSLGDMDELDRLLAMLPEDRVDDVILVEPLSQNGAIDPAHPNALDFSVDVEQPATMQISVTNGGDLVGEFHIEVRGLDPSWIAITPASINLFEGQKGNFSIAITAPRLASSRAKAHYFSVVVSSPNYPGRFSSTAGLLVIKPFYEYAVGDIDPKKQKISWSKKVGTAILPVANLGNGPMPLQISGEDDRHASTIEFDSPEEGIKLVNQLQVTVRPEETQAIKVFVTPRKRRFIAFGGENINYTLTVTPQAGAEQTPRSVLGQASALPFMGPIPIILALILLALLLLWVFTPRISDFKSDVSEIESGQSTELSWQTSFLSTARIVPDVGKLDGPQGTITVSPLENTTYTLTAETWLTYLMPQWFKATRELTITVDPILPVIRVFEATKTLVNTGDDVTITWAVDRADTLILSINGADETIPADQFTGSRTFKMERATVFELRAANDYTGAEGVVQSISVDAQIATSTPAPTPAPQQFDVQPQTITAGDAVTITWAVNGADKVTITGVDGELPASGSVTVRPQVETSYVLTAYHGDAKYTSSQQTVIVNPAPTATPQPQAPQIDFFQASPVEVDIGSDAADNIELSWSINGDVTNVEITGPSSARFTGLPKKGSLRVAASQASLYVITAYNGSLRTSQTAQIKVKNPSPHINSISPTSSTEVGSNGFTLVVNGFGFVEESKVQVAGSNRNTVFVSETQLTASIVAEDLVRAATFEVKVFNATPGGGTSNGVVFTLNNPVPTLTSLSPGSITKGSDGFTLTVTGTNFVNGSKVRWGGADAPTTYISSTQLTAQILASQITNAGSPAVTVSNPSPGGGSSNTISFTINASNPVPSVNNLLAAEPGVTPSTAKAGVDGQTITVNGANFIPGSLVRWKGTFLTTRYLSDTRLEADIPPEKLQIVGSANITVFNPEPGGGISNAVVFTVTGLNVDIVPTAVPAFFIGETQSLSVTIDAAQADPVVVTLTSSNVSQLTIHQYVASSCITSSAIPSVTIPAGSLSADFCVLAKGVGTPTITALLSPSLGADSAVRSVQVSSSPPSVSGLVAPTSLASTTDAPGVGVGSSSFELTINGSGFQPGALVKWEGESEALATWTGNSNQIKFSVPASFVDGTGDFDIQVRNPSSVLSTVNANSVFHVVQPTGPLTLSPSSATAGGTLPNLAVPSGDACEGYNLSVTGANFVNNSVVLWGGVAKTTAFKSSTQVCAKILPSDIQSGSSVSVRVRNPPTSCFIFCNQTSTATFTIGSPTLTLTPDTTSVTVGSTTLFTVTLGSAQSVSRDINLTAGLAANVSIKDSTCTTTVTQITIDSPGTTGSFCVQGNIASATAVDITATMSGFASATDTSSLTVSAATTTVTVVKSTPSGNPATSESVTFTVTVSSTGGVPPGSVTLTDSLGDDIDPECTSVALVSGQATCSTSGLKSHNSTAHTITATYTSSSTNFSGNSGNTSVTVSKATTSAAVEQAATSSVYGQAVTLTARINAQYGGSLTGNIVYRANGSASAFATQAVTNLASGSTSTLALSQQLDASATAYSITAEYDDTSTHYQDSDPSTAISHTINRADTSVSLVKFSPAGNPVTGQSVQLRATVTADSPSTATVNTGAVAFRLGSTSGADIPGCAGISVNASGQATCTTTFDTGSYTIYAVFGTTTNFTGSTSSALSVTVNKAATTASITSDSPDPSVVGETITVNYTVTVDSPGGGTPTGTVTVSDGVNSCSASVATGSCTLALTTVGTRSLTASYAGDSNYSTDTSTVASHTVNKADTSVNTSNIGVDTSATCSAAANTACFRLTSVDVVAPGSGTPSGSVTFNVYAAASGGSPVATVSGTVGTGYSSFVTLTNTTYYVSATYSGNTSFNASAESGRVAFTP